MNNIIAQKKSLNAQRLFLVLAMRRPTFCRDMPHAAQLLKIRIFAGSFIDTTVL